jgi:hypothetical protein
MPLELITRAGVRSQDDQLREGGIRQLGVVGKEEPRRPLANVGGDDFGLRLLAHPSFYLDGGGRGRLDAGPLRHLHFDQHLGPVGA